MLEGQLATECVKLQLINGDDAAMGMGGRMMNVAAASCSAVTAYLITAAWCCLVLFGAGRSAVVVCSRGAAATFEIPTHIHIPRDSPSIHSRLFRLLFTCLTSISASTI